MQNRLNKWIKEGDIRNDGVNVLPLPSADFKDVVYHEVTDCSFRTEAYSYFSQRLQIIKRIQFIWASNNQKAIRITTSPYYFENLIEIANKFFNCARLIKSPKISNNQKIIDTWDRLYPIPKPNLMIKDNSIIIEMVEDNFQQRMNDFIAYIKDNYHASFQFDNMILDRINKVITYLLSDGHIELESNHRIQDAMLLPIDEQDYHSWQMQNPHSAQLVALMMDVRFHCQDYIAYLTDLSHGINRKPSIITKLKRLLVLGADVKATTSFGESAAFLILHNIYPDDIKYEIAKLFLAYDVPVHEPYALHEMSLLEYTYQEALMWSRLNAKCQDIYAKHYQKPNESLINLFLSTLVKLNKPIAPITLIASDVIAKKESVVTVLKFSDDNTLFCHFTRSCQLSDATRDALYEIYAERFEIENSASKKARELIFTPDDDKFINVISNQRGQVVGAAVYRVKRMSHKFWVYIDTILFSAKHLSYGIMPLLSYQLSFGLQMLYSCLPVWNVFLSASYTSYKWTENGEFFPKRQPEYLLPELLRVLNEFGLKFTFVHNENACYIIEDKPAVVKGTLHSKIPSSAEELYLSFRGVDGKTPPDKIKERDVLVALPTSYELLLTLQKMLAVTNINFYSTIIDFAMQLVKSDLLKYIDLKPQPNPMAFFQGAKVFRNNQLVPVNEPDFAKMLKHPAVKNNLTKRL